MIKPELPEYICNKVVKAFKILKIVSVDNRKEGEEHAFLLQSEWHLPARVDQAFMDKNKPTSGGYFVIYEDGYQSFSPAKAFEEGYTLLEKSTAMNAGEKPLSVVERVIEERRQLETNLSKLGDFMTAKAFTELDDAHKVLLEQQHEQMIAYSGTLLIRIILLRSEE